MGEPAEAPTAGCPAASPVASSEHAGDVSADGTKGTSAGAAVARASAASSPQAGDRTLSVPANRSSGSSGMGSTICMATVVMMLGLQVYGLVETFRGVPCPTGAGLEGCYRPFFEDGELIDMAVYLTADPGLKWWTAAGLEELQEVPFWNASGLAFGQPATDNASALQAVSVPLSAELLRGVRRNESKLYAHLFVFRAGTRLSESLPGSKPKRGGPGTPDLMSFNVLHTKEAMTRILPQVVAQRRNLLATVNETGPPPVHIPLVAGWSVPLFPGEALAWTSLFFSLTAFASPHPALAAVRHCSAVAIPVLYHLRKQQAEEARAMQQKAQEPEQWMFAQPDQLVPHLVPQLHISVPSDTNSYDAQWRPPILFQEVKVKPGNPVPGQADVRYTVVKLPPPQGGLRYIPPVSLDIWRDRRREWRPLGSDPNKSDPFIGVEVTFEGMVRYTVVQSIRESVKMYMNIGFSERDLEEIWEFVFRHPLHIMALMQLIGFIQVTLSTLAFKNDISFFKGRRDYTGLSSRSLATDTLQQIVIFLYLYDFDDISRIILFQTGTSAGIDAWKFARVARLRITWLFFLPWVTYNRGSSDSDESGTEEIDAAGMRMLKFVLYPLSFCWAVYALMRYSYKSWWSWAVSSMADFAYTFGFVNMMPQIFINYKLKSVAHMPWRVLMYKFFNTFIDDVFAFFIMSEYMTKKHRMMTLRDDIVFFIFLYQRHIYAVDPTRPDEYGLVYGDAAKTALEGTRPETGGAAGPPATEALAAGPSDSTQEPAASGTDGPEGDAPACASPEGCRKRSAAAAAEAEAS